MELFQMILKDVVYPVLVVAMTTILGKVISMVGKEFVDFLKQKKQAIATKEGADKYNQYKTIALDVWNFVEEHFRVKEVVGKATEEKIALFDEQLKKHIPSLTDAEIELLRQAIAGVINASKEVILSDVTEPEKEEIKSE